MKHSQVFDNAKWIDCENGTEAPLFLRKFDCKDNEKVSISICGLGFFALWINGRRVGNDLLVPSVSNYSDRDMSKWIYPLYDRLSFRKYFVEYDLTSYVVSGENSAVVMLGGGYYHQVMRQAEGNVSYGNPKLCYIIRKESGNIVSDSNTFCNNGFFSQCNLFYGEKQDFSSVPDEKDFVPSREIDEPETELYRQECPSDKVVESLSDFKLIGSKEGYNYYDIGINTVGYAVLKCGKRNEKITVSYAEEIGGNYWFGIHFSNEGLYTDEFITDGSDREYHEMFGWQAFRYLKISDNAELVRVDVVHSGIENTSEFECSNKTLNWLYETYIHTQLCNMHSGVPSDCPHRERLGYTGDGQLCCESGMLLLDSKAFYRKWLYDIADCQNLDNGHVQHTAPAMGGGGGPCGWGGAMIEVPYQFYKTFGDEDLLREFYPKMIKFLEYIETRSDNGLVCREEPGGWCLGDWLPPEKISLPETFVNTCLYIYYLKTMLKVSDLLGYNSYCSWIKEKIDVSEKAVTNAYYSFQQRAYCGDVNGASSIAYRAGLTDENVKNEMVSKYKKLGRFDTGIIATETLIGSLFDMGESQLAFDLLSNETDVSFNHMMKCGATTLWENWNGESSRNHPMFGAVTKYLFTGLLGIKQEPDSAGYRKITVSPAFVNGLDYFKGSILTASGRISVECTQTDEKKTIKVYVDPKIEACLIFGNLSEKISGERYFEIYDN